MEGPFITASSAAGPIAGSESRPTCWALSSRISLQVDVQGGEVCLQMQTVCRGPRRGGSGLT